MSQRVVEQDKKTKFFENKYQLQNQMQIKEQQRYEAYQEYLKEKDQVDRVVQRMINEDVQHMQMTKQKQEQAKQDMIMSVNEKNAMKRRQKELEDYENEMLKRFLE